MPIFRSIVDSSLWREPAIVSKLFITMVFAAGPDGIVRMGATGLADRAKLARAEFDEAIYKLESPDPDSTTKEFDGRRVIAIDGVGWRVVNFNNPKYRAATKLTEAEKSAQAKVRVGRMREQARIEQTGSLLPPRPGTGYDEIAAHLASIGDSLKGKLMVDDRRRCVAEYIFLYWCMKLGHKRNTRFDSKRERTIVRALENNDDDMGELCYVIDGAAEDTRFANNPDCEPGELLTRHDIPVIFRDRPHIEKYLTTSGYLKGEPHPYAQRFDEWLRKTGQSELL